MAKKFSYTETLHQIEEIVQEIENGELEIDELSSKVKLVSQLIKKCKTHLRKTEEEINHILDDFDEN